MPGEPIEAATKRWIGRYKWPAGASSCWITPAFITAIAVRGQCSFASIWSWVTIDHGVFSKRWCSRLISTAIRASLASRWTGFGRTGKSRRRATSARHDGHRAGADRRRARTGFASEQRLRSAGFRGALRCAAQSRPWQPGILESEGQIAGHAHLRIEARRTGRPCRCRRAFGYLPVNVLADCDVDLARRLTSRRPAMQSRAWTFPQPTARA